ncbi:2',5'-phosphodiesterase 12 [Achroia grisella]|uniref:2',5'-phosphodiesterase 12 n=1 Tax=Achroia grisella TaxID=688607 RepID=UPI0027D2ECAD|nr:2',5'-phosphodiesterase 12 [Achroia grisella]
MIYKFSNWYRNINTFVSLSKTKAMNLNKCYFRYVESDDKIDISFLLKVKETVRQFNFSRKPTENIESLLTRMGNNIQKFVTKGNKKASNELKVVTVQIYDDKNNAISEQATCKDLFLLQSPVKLHIYDHIYEVVFNVPWVVSINLPQCILSGFPVHAENFVVQYADNRYNLYTWYKGISINDKGNEVSEAHIKWEKLGNEYIYIPTTKDIGMKLKLECTPGNDKTSGPTVGVISKNVVEAGPGTCPFEIRHMFTTTKLTNKRFRCVTYNILADLYCDSDYTRSVLHPYCPSYALHIDYRKQLILKELLGYNADIICLQEVDGKIFQSSLSPLLGSDGFEGKFYKKGKEVAEGLACFYRKDRYDLLDEEKILLSDEVKTRLSLQSIWNAIKDNSPLITRLLDRSTVASATILQSFENPNDVIIVGNTHLYFHPDADHIRLIQGGIIVYWLNEIRSNLIKQMPNKRISVILCGDFNSVPSCGIYQLYTTGSAPSSLLDWKSNADEAVHNLSLQQDLHLRSACGTPPFTNFTAGFADCLDYIFYDKSNLEVVQVVPLPSEEELRVHIALPSIVFPSDHIALISDFQFK